MIKRLKYSEIKEQNNKKRLKPRKGRFALLISVIIFVLIDIFLVTEYKARGVDALGYQMMEKINELFDSGSDFVSSFWEGNLKQDNNLTSFLVVGIDTRDVEFTGTEFISTNPEHQAGTRNTDTIMQLVYDHSNGSVTLISIPRDMGVDVVKECLDFHGSLHWVYDKGQSANCPGGGVQTLVETVENITGVKVQYSAFISLEAFEDIINTVGEKNENGESGVWIDIEEPIYELYPSGDYGWESVYFPEGRQFLTAEEALKYARSRKVTSDFGRAERQQKLISAVKERIMSSDTLSDPRKILSLLKTFREYSLFTEPTMDEVKAALNIARDLDENEILNIVLDPHFGGEEAYLNKRPHDKPGGPYYMVPTHWAECPEGDSFCEVKKYIAKVMRYPEVYQENAIIYAYAKNYNESWTPDFANQKYKDILDSNVPLNITESKYIANIETDSDVVVYDYSNGEKKETIEMLKTLFGVSVLSGDEAPYVRINNEDLSIVVNGN